MLDTALNALTAILDMWNSDLGTLMAGLTAFNCSIYLFMRIAYRKG